MTKLRSDSVWRGLSVEQRAQLETWLFEKNLSYQGILELVRKEFGLKTSLTSLKMFCRRLAEEREESQQRAEVLKEIGYKKGWDDETVKKMRAAADGLVLVKMVDICAMPGITGYELAALCRAMTANRKIDLELQKGRLEAETVELRGGKGGELSVQNEGITAKVSLSQAKSG